MSKKATLSTQDPTDSLGSEEETAKPKQHRSQKAKPRRVAKKADVSPPVVPDPYFEFHLGILLNARLKRIPFYDWRVMRCSNRELYVAGRTARGLEVSSALLGISFDTLTGLNQESELILLTGKPNPDGDTGVWTFHCEMSGTDEATTIDITPQVWKLALAMNGMLTTTS